MPENKSITVWARVGMTGHLTQKQLDRLVSKKVRSEEMLEWIKDGTFELDGETYFPEGADENEGVMPPDFEIGF